MTGFLNHVFFIVDIGWLFIEQYGWLFIEQYARLMFIDNPIIF